MPFVSQAQRGYMYVHHPKIAKEFEEHTPHGMRLPYHKAGSKSSDKKHAMAAKMHAAIDKASVNVKKKRYERTLDRFIKHGREEEQNKAWEYARENRMSDKRMF